MEVVERFLTGSRVRWEERGPASGLGWSVNIIQKGLSASRYTHDSFNLLREHLLCQHPSKQKLIMFLHNCTI